MKKNVSTIAWGIRAGKGGKAHNLFIDESVIALEDAELGDFRKFDANRESFCSAYRELHPEDTRSGSAGIVGKFFRFTHEISSGDLIVYPALPDKQVYVGEVTGAYEYVSSADYPHQRQMKWKYLIPKREFSQTAQYELGAARTFFQFKNNVDELVQKMNDKSVTRFRAKAKAK